MTARARRRIAVACSTWPIDWPWTLALVLLAAVLLAALPGFQARVGRTLRQRPALSVLLGVAWLVCRAGGAAARCCSR